MSRQRAVLHGNGLNSLSILLLLLLATPYTVAQSSADSNRYVHTQISPAMATVILVVIAMIFFVGFFSIYIHQCSGRTSGGSVRQLGTRRLRRESVARGIDAEVIETFPMLVYSEVKGLKIGKGALECAVCLNEFEDDETLRLLPKCDHVFHPDCIDAWLASHTTCPVCRANLSPQSGDSLPQLAFPPLESDLEAQNDALESQPQDANHGDNENMAPEPEVMTVDPALNRDRTRGSTPGTPRKFFRSHSTGHSLIVQRGENTERFTLRLPAEVRKKIMNPELNRATSQRVLPREGSSRRGYRTGGGEGSSRGRFFNYKRQEQLDQTAKSDRWVFSRNPSFLARASSFLTRASSSVKSPKTAVNDGEGSSVQRIRPNAV